MTYCIVTDGDAGGHDLAVERAAMAGIRRAEQEAAAKEVGVRALVWLGASGPSRPTTSRSPGASKR